MNMTNNQGGKQQSKRSSCDRCRAQKLKCIRPDQLGPCQRCTSAKTHCSFEDNGSQAAQTTASTSTVPRQAATAFLHNPEMMAPNLPQDFYSQRAESSRPPPQGLQRSINPTNTVRPPSSQAGTFDDGNPFNLLNDPALADFDMSMSGATSLPQPNTPHSIGAASWQQPAWLSDACGANSRALSAMGMNDHLFDQGAPSQRLDMVSSSNPSPSGSRPPSLAHVGMDMASASTPRSRRHHDTSVCSDRRQSLQDLDTASASKLTASLMPNFAAPVGNSLAAQNQRMQQLMQLASLMHEMQIFYSQDGSSSQAVSFDGFPTEFAGKVLQAAAAFLKTLGSFFSDDSHPPSSASSSSSSSAHQYGLSGVSTGHADKRQRGPLSVSGSVHSSSEMLFSRASAPTYAPSTSSTAASTASSVSSYPHGIYAADKPTVLQLIACYLRFLQLYLLLYTAIDDYICANDRSARRQKPIWDGLNLGGAMLDTFADFQIKLVLHVAEHLLSEIEAVLGLSEGCRVSKKTAAEGSGVLGASVTARFMEMSMAEAAAGRDEGSGAILQLKNVMERVASLLDPSSQNDYEVRIYR